MTTSFTKGHSVLNSKPCESRPVPAIPRRGQIKWLTWPSLLGLLLVSVRADAQDIKPATLDRVKKATLMVRVAESRRQRGDSEVGGGTGYFINNTGLLMTNNHVIDPTHGAATEEERERWYYEHGTLTFRVVVNSGTDQEQTYEATRIYQSLTADQALLQAKDKDGNKLKTPNYIRLLPSSRLKADMRAWALGFPGLDQQSSVAGKHPEVTVTGGRVLDIPRTPGGRLRRIYTDVVANRGNSGGPMVDVDGYLVGTVTLKSKPEGREAESGGDNYSALSPTELTREMILTAFQLKKIPEGTDFTPFIDILTNAEGRIEIPEFRRQRNMDVLFFPNGDKTYGVVSTDKIHWESPIGALEVPAPAVAYVMRNDEATSLFLEGGNRIQASQSNQKLRFKPDKGNEAEADYDVGDLAVVGFKTSGRSVQPVNGKVIVFDSDLSHLVLSDVTGTATFQGKKSTVKIALEDILRIERVPDGEDQIVILGDEQRMTGRFTADPITAKIAATGLPISFNLSQVAQATVEVLFLQKGEPSGLGLSSVVAKADRDVLRVVKLLQNGDVKAARQRLTELAPADELKSLPLAKRELINFLDGVLSIREGQYETAKKILRASSKAQDESIAAFAAASVEVLKANETQYKGRPLSDPAAFAAAGKDWATGMVQKVRGVIRDNRRLKGERRADYQKILNDAKKYEDDMRVAAVFAGTNGDDEMLRLWKLVTDGAEAEIRRLDKAIKEKQDEGAGNRRGGAANRMQREIEDMRKEREAAVETWTTYNYQKRQEYGFRIEDPDIQRIKEAAQGEPAEEEGP